MEKQNKKNYNWLKWLLGLILIVAIVAVVIAAFRPRETRFSDDNGFGASVESVSCSTSDYDGEDAFFEPDETAEYQHVVKATFKDGKGIDKISYDYLGKYENDKQAEHAEAVYHADYNIYMSDNSLTRTSLNPTFSIDGNEIKISLFANQKNLNSSTIKFFFLNMDEFQRIKSYTPEELKKAYEQKGFDCEVKK